jgi:hypothetical protein
MPLSASVQRRAAVSARSATNAWISGCRSPSRSWLQVQRVQELAVDVELDLVPGAVADANRRRVAPPAQVAEHALGEVVLAADPVHDLQRALARAAAGRAGHERDELLGLVGARADVERLDRQARVADPREAVVPVALAADRLRQRGRRGGDDRPGRAVRQALEHARAQADQLAVRAVVDVVLGLPRAPRLNGVVDALRDPVGGRRGRGLGRLGRGVPQREAGALPGLEGEGRAHGRVGELERHGRRDGDATGAERARAAVHEPDQRADQPVLGSRRELHPEVDAPAEALDAAQDLVRRVVAECVAALALGERHRVAHPRRARAGGDDRLDDERAGQVAPCGGECAHGAQ